MVGRGPVRVAGLFLVDPRGFVLLQERDEHAPIAPNQWGIVGGHVDPGEDWLSARDRELHEETGLRLPDETLRLWFDGVRHSPTEHRDVHWQIWVGVVHLTDADIVVGEGRQIVFVDPVTVDRLDLGEATAHFLPLFLASPSYRALVEHGRTGSAPPAPGGPPGEAETARGSHPPRDG